MRLEGSCQCGKVTFHVESETPYPFMNCYCSICRKLAGGAYGTNIMGKRATLKIRGEKFLRGYHARVREPGKPTRTSRATRSFCGECGTHLWLMDDEWPDGVWPSAAVIDTPLPVPPPRKCVHIMTRFKPAWVVIAGPGKTYPRYPELSIQKWHEDNGLLVDGAKARKPRKRTTAK
jgi:hypothetical protein